MQFDVWHVSKNITSKLRDKAKGRGCNIIFSWIKSTINRFWWYCASCHGNEVELKEKWLSLMYHTVNKHSWEDLYKVQFIINTLMAYLPKET